MIQLYNVKTQELIKIKNYQYKTMNIKTRVSIRIQVKYEQYKDKKKKNTTKIKKLME
jgi:tRNA U34 5-carboxymethylaminomethyl modifying enzyme MnmG/GidA